MSRSRPKAASFSSLLLIIVMKGEVTFVVQFGVGPLFEAIAEDDDAAAGRDLEVEFDMPMSEDIVVAVVAYFLLLFGEEDEFFFVLPFVGAGVGYLVEPALFRPGISEFVTPCRREQAEEELRGGRVEEFLEADEGLDLSNVTLVHNPCSNLKLGSGVAPLAAWLERGVSVALGTDGASSNNRLDMWEEMRTAALLHKGVNKDPLCVSALEVLRMATYEGARAFGFAQKGMIREGWVADLVLVDLDKPHYIGADEENLATYIVYAGSSADVAGTMVNGKWLYRKTTGASRGDYPTLDYEEIVQRAREARAEITR